jgi:hypothetical protein
MGVHHRLYEDHHGVMSHGSPRRVVPSPPPVLPWNSLPGFSTQWKENEGKALRHLRKRRRDTLRKNLWPSQAAGLYWGREAKMGPQPTGSTLRGTSACLSYRLGFLSTLWWEKGGWRGMGIRQGGWGGGLGEVLDIWWEDHLGSAAWLLFFFYYLR